MVSFKVFGINSSVSIGFLCIITLLMYCDKTGYMPTALFAAMIHEAGHIASLKMLKSPPQRVVFKIGTISLEGRYNLTQKGRLFMIFSGPLANLFTALVYLGLFYVFGSNRLLELFVIMLIFCVFNLLPVTGLDGGEITAIFLCKNLKYKTAKFCSKAISITFCLLGLALGGFVFLRSGKNPSLLLLFIYLLVCTFKNDYEFL